MPTNPFTSVPRKMLSRGLWFGPIDLMPAGYFARLQNVRSRQPGSLIARPGLFQFNYTAGGAAQTIEDPSGTTLPVYSLSRLQDDAPPTPGEITLAVVGNEAFPPAAQLWTTAKTASASFAARNYSASDNPRHYTDAGPTTLASPGNIRLSGFPAAITPYRPSDSAQSWAYIGDTWNTQFGRLPKISPNNVVYFWGVEPPNTGPTTAVGGPGVMTGSFSYRARYRSSEGARSNSGFRQPDGEIDGASPPLTVAGTTITVSIGTPAADTLPDPQVAYIDIFRSSDAVPSFHYLTTIDLLSLTSFGPTSPTLSILGNIISFDDNAIDIEIASADLLDDDNDVPWPTVNVTGAPTRINLPFVWGPFQGSIFGCGDVNRAGYLYWTKPFFPDSAPPDTNLEITSPNEPLMNGFLWDGRCWIFSTERLFAVYPNFASPSRYDVNETPCGHGLANPWGLALGPKIWFLSRDGIYETDGGPAVSITGGSDLGGSLYRMFKHEGAYPDATSFNGIDFPNFDTKRTRLSYADGYLYFDYQSRVDQTFKTLVYNVSLRMWESYDAYQAPIRIHYQALGRQVGYPGSADDSVLLGGNDGKVYFFTAGKDGQTTPGGETSGTAYSCVVRDRAEDFGTPRSQKLIGDIMHEFDRGGETVSVRPYFDNETVNEAATAVSTGTGRTPRTLDINGGLGRLARNITLDFSWSVTGVVSTTELFSWQPSAAPKPDEQVKRLVEWHEFLSSGEDAYITGIEIWADTEGVDVTFQIWSDLTNTGLTRTFNANGERKIAFSWPSFKGRLGRLVVTTSAKWRITNWVWVAMPEPLLEPDFDTNWRNALPEGGVGYVTGVQVTLDTVSAAKTLILQSQFEGTVTTLTPIGLAGNPSVTHNGRLAVSYSFVPFRANQLRLYSTDQVQGRLYEVLWIVHKEPPTLTNWDAEFTHDGYLGAKFLQGFIVDGDTNNTNKTVLVEYEDGNSFTVTVNNGVGRQGKAYAFAVPVIATIMRARPTDANKNWLYGVKWIWEPHPEKATRWQTQSTSMDMRAFGHIKESFIAVQSAGDVTLTINIDGTNQAAYTLVSTASGIRKLRVPHVANKGKLYTYTFTAVCPFRIFKKDCEVHAKSWGNPGPYIAQLLFGGQHRADGAAI